MADPSPPASLSDRAAQILKLVGELADAIRANEGSNCDETQQRVASAWQSLLPAIVELGKSLPAVSDPVTDWIREVGRVSKSFSDAVGQHGLADVLFRFNCDGFLRVYEEGRQLFKDIGAKRDPFAFVNPSAFTLLDRFPATPAGHVAFLEMVRDEIHHAANGKRNQFAEKYSNDTIASMIRGRDFLMAEAVQRIATLSELPPETVEQVACVLRRELTVGTVERIDELFTPAVRELRDALEQSRSKESPAVDNRAVMETGTVIERDAVTRPTKPTGKKKPSATVNDRMAGTIMENPEAMGWNSTQWAKHLKCGKSTVVETATWKKLESARLQAKAEQMKDRRRKPKASDSRRD